MITQLNPPIWVNTNHGKGLALAIIDYGPDHDLLWLTAVQPSGEMWAVNNKFVRYDKNESLGFSGEQKEFRWK